MSTELTKKAGFIAVGTTGSRILGYFRDMLVAHVFGAGVAADAFYAAYRIPNLLRRLLGEGSLSASFIPVLSEYLHTKSREETQELISVVFTALTIVMAVLTAMGIIFAEPLVSVIAYGFADDPEKLALTITLTKLMFPFVFFICLAALLLGILNTMGAFFLPAIAPASLSVAEICFIMGIAPALTPDDQIKGLAISVIIGGVGQFLVQWPRIRALGWHLRWKLSLKHPGLKQIGTLMIPSMIGLSVDQINAFVDTMAASFLALGSITALYYSNRVMQLPLAIFGLAMASVALPAMSRSAARQDMAALKDTLNYSIRLIIFILVPSAVGLMVLGIPIISVLFERGNFTHEASLMTNSALFFYSLGLPAYAIAKVMASAFYSQKETKIPVKVGVAAMLLNVVLIIVLMPLLKVGGLALATALASYFNFSVLAVLLRRRIGPIGLRRILHTTAKTCFSAAVMGVVCYFIAFRWLAAMPTAGLISAMVAGFLVFFGTAHILKQEEMKPLLAVAFRQKPTGEE